MVQNQPVIVISPPFIFTFQTTIIKNPIQSHAYILKQYLTEK